MFMNDTPSKLFSQTDSIQHEQHKATSNYYHWEIERIYQQHLFAKKQKFAEIEKKHYAGVKKLFKQEGYMIDLRLEDHPSWFEEALDADEENLLSEWEEEVKFWGYPSLYPGKI